MIALVCGGRDFNDYDSLSRFLDVEEITCIVHGGARGADYLAGEYGKERGLPVFRCDANWDFYKKGAGPVRNGWMLSFMRPDIVIAFPTPKSVGTWDMLRQAERAGVQTLVNN